MDALRRIFKSKLAWAILILVVIGGIYLFYPKSANVNAQYTLGTVEKGTISTSVSGTGQVSTSSQLDIKSKVSGQVLDIPVKNGDQIKAGTVIAKIDPKDAQKAVRDAELALESAKVTLQKTQQPSDEYTIKQAQSSLDQAKLDLAKLQSPPTDVDLMTAQDAVTQAQRDLDQAKDNLLKSNLNISQTQQKAYDDAYNTISTAYLDMPDLVKDSYSIQWEANTNPQSHISGYEEVLGKNSLFISQMEDDYTTASQAFDKSFNNYKTVSRDANQDIKYSLLTDTLSTAKLVYNSLQSDKNLLDAVINYGYYKNHLIASTVDTWKPKIQSDITLINKDIADLQNAKDALDTSKQNNPLDTRSAQAAVDAATEKLNEKQAALKKLKDGATAADIASAQLKVQQQQDALDKVLKGGDPLDVRAQEINVQQRANALTDARQALADYSVKIPFDGIISKIDIVKGDTISGNTVVASAISQQKLAEVSLNEVDVAKVKVGDKAILKFDAIEGLTISGEVAEIDTVGTVTQGVVTYNVKIAFDTQDERVKSGMSVSASIITEVKQDVLTVPNSAVKTQGDVHYVEILDNVPVSNASENGTQQVVSSAAAPRQQEVEVGLSNDSMTEITSGLKEGDQVVVKSSSSSSSRTTTPNANARSGLSIFGGGGRGFGG